MAGRKLPILLSSNWPQEDVETFENELNEKIEPKTVVEKIEFFFSDKRKNFEIKKIEKDEEKKKIAEKAVQKRTLKSLHSPFFVIHFPILSEKSTSWIVKVEKKGSKLKSSIILSKENDYESLIKNESVIFLKHVYENKFEQQKIDELKKMLKPKETIVQKIEKKIEKVEEKFEKVEETSIEEFPSNLEEMKYNFLPDFFVDRNFCYVKLIEKPGTEKSVIISVYQKDINTTSNLRETKFSDKENIYSLLIKNCNVGSV
jgi:uncharacterized coiled-coil protein SlyX